MTCVGTRTWSSGSSRFGQARKDRDLVSEASCPGMRWVDVWGGSRPRVLETKGRAKKSTLRAQGQTPERSGANTGAPEAKEKRMTVKLPEVRVRRWGRSGVKAGGGQGKKGSESVS